MKRNHRDELGFRIYTFRELMTRLTSPTWSVAAVSQGFLFVPTMYRKK